MAQKNYFEVRSRIHTNCLVCKLIVHQVPKLQLPYHYANPVRLWREDRSRVELRFCTSRVVIYEIDRTAGAKVPAAAVPHHRECLQPRGAVRARVSPSPGRHCHSTLPLTAIGCHPKGIYTIILLSLLPPSAQMTVLPHAGPARAAARTARRRTPAAGPATRLEQYCLP